jgi:hypothetical protein
MAESDSLSQGNIKPRPDFSDSAEFFPASIPYLSCFRFSPNPLDASAIHWKETWRKPLNEDHGIR